MNKLLLLSYLLIPVYLPAFGAVDPVPARWMALSALNLLALIVLMARRGRGEGAPEPAFPRTLPGLLWTLLLAVMLLSFIPAINLSEWLITFSRMSAAFAAAWLISILFRSGKEMLPFLALALAVLVILESAAVTAGVVGFIRKSAVSIYEIRFTYTNKNILAAAIFLKLPGPLWLLFFTRGWQRNLAAVAIFMGALSLFFLSARAFYIGMALFSATLAGYALIRYRRAGEKQPAASLVRFLLLGALALGFYTFTQKYLYPKDRDTWNYNKSVVSRVAEIKTEVSKPNQPAGIRLSSWQRTLNLIRQNPWLGVGAGNWKVAVLRYENQERSDFNYMLHNHNDFTQITAATGLPGGILFVLLVLAIPVAFLLAARHPVPFHPAQQWLFLPALGILAFAVDAFFNYPLARPEIITLFAVFIAAGTFKLLSFKLLRFKLLDFRLTGFKAKINNDLRGSSCLLRVLRVTLPALLLTLLLLLQIFLYHSARIEKQLPATPWRSMSLPAFPSLTTKGEPVAVVKARYLIRQKRYAEAIALLYPDRSSPWDSRREYLLSKAYAGLGQPEKAAWWLAMARKIKPAGGD